MIIREILLLVALLGTLTSTVYLGMVLYAAARFRRARRKRPQRTVPATLPPVSVLKPVCGMEPLLRESLETFFRLDYPEYEIVFGARNSADPALAVVSQLTRQYPRVPVQVVLAGEPEWPNAKVWSLAKMIEGARHELIVMSDSDVMVQPGYLQPIVAPLLNEEVGLVTCVYRGRPVGGLWSLLEALGMSVEFASGVLVAEMLEGMTFALGPTMATRKRDLEAIGGAAMLGQYCADDFVIGNRMAESGRKVVLAEEIIDHVVLNTSLFESLAHQVRWMRSTRYSRPMGHLGCGLTYPWLFTALGLLVTAADQPQIGLGILGLTLAGQVAQSIVVGWGILGDKRALRYAWLYPLRGLLGTLVWAGSYTSSVIGWRGERYRLQPGGRMVRLEPAASRVPSPQASAPADFD